MIMPENKDTILTSITVPKPWGNYIEFTRNTPSTVKILNVDPGQAISLQKHKEREEFWLVISGNGTITIGEERLETIPHHEYHIKKEVLHRIEAGSERLVILEIALGHADENEIVRIEDNYGRSEPQMNL